MEQRSEPFDPNPSNDDGVGNDVPFTPLWQRFWEAAILERVSGNLWVKGFVGCGWTGAMTPNRHGVSRRTTTQHPNAETLLTQLGLCNSKPAVEPDAPFSALEGGGGEATPGLPCKVSPDGMMAIPKLDGVDHCIQQSLGGEAEGGRPPFEQRCHFPQDQSTAKPLPLFDMSRVEGRWGR
jgi:hypothetical protein